MISSQVVAGMALVTWVVAAVIIAASAVAARIAALRSAVVISPLMAPDGGPPRRLGAVPMLPLPGSDAVVVDGDGEERPGCTFVVCGPVSSPESDRRVQTTGRM